MKFYLSVCYQFRNEAPYLREWIEFHRIVGVEHFFLYNHFSTDNFSAALGDYIEQEIVTLIDWSQEPKHDRAQAAAHEHCLDEFGTTSRWMAFIDVDEFLFSPNSASLADALRPYEPFPGVFVHWQTYGSNSHLRKPEGLVIENYDKRAPDDFPPNLKGKSIVNPHKAFATTWNSPHYFFYRQNRLAVNENFEPVDVELGSSKSGSRLVTNSLTVPSAKKLRINHYCVKSRQDFEEKAEKATQLTRYDEEFFEIYDRNEIYDPILAPYIPEVKAALSRH